MTFDRLARPGALAALLAAFVLGGCSGSTSAPAVPSIAPAAQSVVSRAPEDTSGGIPFSADMSVSSGATTFGDGRSVERVSGNDALFLVGEVDGTMKMNGRPLINGFVQLFSAKGHGYYATQTKEGGRFAFSNVGRDYYFLVVNGVLVPPQFVKIEYHR